MKNIFSQFGEHEKLEKNNFTKDTSSIYSTKKYLSVNVTVLLKAYLLLFKRFTESGIKIEISDAEASSKLRSLK